MSISLRLSDEEANIIKSYAKLKNQSVSEVMRNAIMEQIETEYDLKIYEKAMVEYRKSPKTYTHEEVKKILELG